MFNIQTHQEGNAWVITIRGRVTFRVTAELRDVIRELLMAHQPELLVINFEHVDYIDSSGLGLLVSVHNNMGMRNGNLHLCGISPQVMKIFKNTNLANYFMFFATAQDALRKD